MLLTVFQNKTRLILDISCGVGYGTSLLAESEQGRKSKIVEVDISEEAIKYAVRRYSHPNVEFITADATTFSYGKKFDTIVSLETVEHIHNPTSFLSHLVGLLAPGGRIITLVPVTPSVDANPHHITDFSSRSFRGMFRRLNVEEIAHLTQVQPYSLLGF